MKNYLILFLLGFAAQGAWGQSDNNSFNKIYVSVEIMPEFPGGEAAMLKFISKNIKYPSKAVRNGIEGTVRLKFTVSSTGKIKDILIISKPPLGYGCEKEAIRVLKKMPKWKPGSQNGKPVSVYFSIPIRFRLN